MSDKRRFELTEGPSSKFWEIWTDGSQVVTRYGRLGSDGQSTTKDQGSPAGATKLLEKLVKEKTGKGYAEVGGGGSSEPASAPKAGSAGDDLEARLIQLEARAGKASVKLPAGATAKAIADAERIMGVTFTEEVRAFYARHDGGGDASVVAERVLSLERMTDEWSTWKKLFDEGTFGENEADGDKGVQKKWWIPQWIP